VGPIKAGAPARERRRQLCGRVISIAALLFKLQNEHPSDGADDSPIPCAISNAICADHLTIVQHVEG